MCLIALFNPDSRPVSCTFQITSMAGSSTGRKSWRVIVFQCRNASWAAFGAALMTSSPTTPGSQAPAAIR